VKEPKSYLLAMSEVTCC